MDANETRKTKKTQEIRFIPKISSKFLSMTNYNDISNYLRNKQIKKTIKRNISISKLFFLLEREYPLSSISQQVHLSETIELIQGTITPDDIRKYRGLILNMERAMTYFYLFHWIFLLFKNKNMANMSLQGYSSFQYIFDTLWQLQFPWGFIRPDMILQPISHTQIPEIQGVITFQQKIGWQIAKKIEKTPDIKETYSLIENLSIKDIKKTGLTGPVARAAGEIPSISKILLKPSRLLTQQFLKYSFSSNNNFLAVLRIGYSELILALNKMSILIKEYPIKTLDTSEKILNGEITSSFPTVLGESHLTLNVSNNEVEYFNYIPPQISNITGFAKILSTCPNSLKLFVLLFLDPEIAFKVID